MDNGGNNATTYNCTCGKIYMHAQNLKRHKKTCQNKKKLPQTKCYFKDCTQSFFHQTALVHHLEKSHGVKLKIEKHTFKSVDAFNEWKENEEATKFAYFSLQSGKKYTKKAAFLQYYICQYDGSEKVHKKRGEEKKSSRVNKKGRAKTGNKCMARLSVKHSNGTIFVTYIASHNHSLQFANTRHQPLSPTVRNNIKQQLATGISPREVQASLRKGVSVRDATDKRPHFLKQHFITLRRLNEMKKRLKISGHRHSDDATSVMLKVQQLQSEDYDPILLYKPQGGDFMAGKISNQSFDDSNKNFKDTFILGLQTKEQYNVMLKGCDEILCIDSTHCTNKCDFYLINLFVPDQFSKGYPIAHFICNRLDEQIMTWIFMSIKDKNPAMILNAVMTDDDLAVTEALKVVFNKNIRHLLSIWHVLKSWMRKLNQDVNEETLRQEMYQRLCTLLHEKDENTFLELALQFTRLYSQNSSFVNYFKEHYIPRPQKWAMCYRNFPHANIDTNIYIESFHNKLKTYYMEKKPSKRIDDLMDLLLKLEEDDYMRRQRMHFYDNNKSAISQSRHERGVKIKDEDVTIVSDEYKWIIKSQSSGSEYEVKQNETECSSNVCFIRCVELSCVGLCQHLYTCTCADQMTICKHIHKVCL